MKEEVLSSRLFLCRDVLLLNYTTCGKKNILKLTSPMKKAGTKIRHRNPKKTCHQDRRPLRTEKLKELYYWHAQKIVLTSLNNKFVFEIRNTTGFMQKNPQIFLHDIRKDLF